RRRGGSQPPQGGPRPPAPQHQQPRGRNNRNRRDWDRDRPRPAAPQGGGESLGVIEGVLELHPKGYGFLRDPKNNYSAKETDPFVSSTVIEKHGLREGVMVRGEIGAGAKGQGPRLRTIETVDGRTVEEYQQVKKFEELTPINPFEQIKLERGPEPVTMRVMDLLTPIGKGQRALIVSPPRSGKTMLLQDIADSVSVNHPEVHLIVLLIDERPEEVTEMRRRVKGEVVASSLDREVESHIRVSQLVVERGKRLAEEGKDVFILLDSITRLARAFNKWVNNSGRTGTGGLDIRALDIPKKLFGTARRFEEGGSLTVVGTALIETGGRMDDAIFQEFKGTGNMELVLSRELADRRIWPAIDIAQSGTRREEKILSPEVLEGVTLLRRSLITLSPVQAMDDLTRTLRKFPTNRDFLARVQQVM
ncbi:MAG TPA: transcription termination factor Rho, partial [Planctomycetaceae bacterium]